MCRSSPISSPTTTRATSLMPASSSTTLKRGFQWKTLAPALEALAEEAPSPLLGVVYGAGFEDRTDLLAKIAERWPLLGNDAERGGAGQGP